MLFVLPGCCFHLSPTALAALFLSTASVVCACILF